MNGTASINQNNDRLLVSGQLDFGTVVGLWNTSLPLLSKNQKLIFDLAQVTSADSSALALLLEWLKYADRERKEISFQNIPAQLQSIADVSGIGKLFNPPV